MTLIPPPLTPPPIPAVAHNVTAETAVLRESKRAISTHGGSSARIRTRPKNVPDNAHRRNNHLPIAKHSMVARGNVDVILESDEDIIVFYYQYRGNLGQYLILLPPLQWQWHWQSRAVHALSSRPLHLFLAVAAAVAAAAATAPNKKIIST